MTSCTPCSIGSGRNAVRLAEPSTTIVSSKSPWLVPDNFLQPEKRPASSSALSSATVVALMLFNRVVILREPQ